MKEKRREEKLGSHPPALKSQRSAACGAPERRQAEARAFAALRAANLKRTRARETLVRCLAHRHGPFTAEQLLIQMAARAPEAPPCDLATVYRILGKFTEAGIACRVDFADGVARFELAPAKDRHHHHVVCVACGASAPIEGCDLRSQESALRDRGFARLTHRLEFFGVCAGCQAER